MLARSCLLGWHLVRELSCLLALRCKAVAQTPTLQTIHPDPAELAGSRIPVRIQTAHLGVRMGPRGWVAAAVGVAAPAALGVESGVAVGQAAREELMGEGDARATPTAHRPQTLRTV